MLIINKRIQRNTKLHTMFKTLNKENTFGAHKKYSCNTFSNTNEISIRSVISRK